MEWTIWVLEALAILACSSLTTVGWTRMRRAKREALRSGRTSANIQSNAEQGTIGMETPLVISSPDESTLTEDERATGNEISSSDEAPLDVRTPLAPGAAQSHLSTQTGSSENPQPEHFIWEGIETLRQPNTLANWQAFAKGDIPADMVTAGKTIGQAEADPTLNLLAAHKTNHRSARDIPPRDRERALRARSLVRSRREPDCPDSAKTPKPKPAAKEAVREPSPEPADREYSAISVGWKLKRRMATKKGSMAASSASTHSEEIPLQELSVPKSIFPKPIKAHTLVDRPGADTPLMDPKALKPSSKRSRSTSWDLEHHKPANGANGNASFKPDVFPPPPTGKILKNSRLRTRVGADNMSNRPSPLRIDSSPASLPVSVPICNTRTDMEDNKSKRPVTAESESLVQNPLLDLSDAPAIQSVTSRGQGKLVIPDQSHPLQWVPVMPVTFDTDNPTPPYTRPQTPLLSTATISALQHVNPDTPPNTRPQTPQLPPSNGPVQQIGDDQGKGRIVIPDQCRLERLGLLPTRNPSEGVVFDLVSKDDEDDKIGFSISRCTTVSLTGCVDDMQPLERSPNKRPESWDSGIGLDRSDAVPPS